MRLATVLLIIPLALLALAMLISPGQIHLHADAVALVIAFGPAALVAGLAWIVKPRTDAGIGGQ